MFGADKNKTVKIVQLQAFPHENHLSLFMYAHHTPIDQAAERIIVRTSPSQHWLTSVFSKQVLLAGELRTFESEPALYSILRLNILTMIWREIWMLKVYVYEKQIRDSPEEKRRDKLAFISPPQMMLLATDSLGNLPAAMAHL